MESVGYNIRDIRKNTKGYTVKCAVSEINKNMPNGKCITEGLYYKWENEERTPTANEIVAIASAFGITESMLFHWQQIKETQKDNSYDMFIKEFATMDKRRQNIVDWSLFRWSGDTTALVEFVTLYAGLPEADRRDLAAYGIRIYDMCLREGSIEPCDHTPDVDYLKHALKRLWQEF